MGLIKHIKKVLDIKSKGKTKKSLLLLAPIILLLGTIGLYAYFNQSLNLLKKENRYQLELFNDTLSQGNSIIALDTSKNERFIYKYILGANIQFPYTGVLIKPSAPTFLSNYDILTLEVAATKGTRLSIVYGTNSTNEKLGIVPQEYILEVNSTPSEYSIPLQSFKTPDWWLKEHDLKEFNPLKDKIIYLKTQNCGLLKKGIEDMVEVKKIVLQQDSWMLIQIWIIALLVYYPSLFFYLKRKKVFLQVKNIEIDSLSNGNEIINFITSSYQNPNLSMGELQNKFCLSHSKIASLIKQETDLGFKQFLNYVRITASKKLLEETEIYISEIAFAAGYENVTHYNRIFKKSEGMSPKSYRNLHLKLKLKDK